MTTGSLISPACDAQQAAASRGADPESKVAGTLSPPKRVAQGPADAKKHSRREPLLRRSLTPVPGYGSCVLRQRG